MSQPFDGFPKASFGGLEFPYLERTLEGGIRFHPHEFPHTPGAEIEKQGRRAYKATFKAYFHRLVGAQISTLYPDLYPGTLNKLRAKFEEEATDDLVIPGVGTIKAVATQWKQTLDARTTSGEAFDLEFIEDQDKAKLVDVAIVTRSVAMVTAANDELQARAALADWNKQATVSIFQRINDAVTTVQGEFGRADAFSRVVEGKLRQLENLCSWADRQVDEIQTADNHLVVEALKDLWLSTRTLAENVTNQQENVIKHYTVPSLMTIGQVATAIYGTSEKSVDILQINAFEDAFAIPPGTDVKYVAPALS